MITEIWESLGKLKQVGAHSITYNKNYTSYVRAGITGKIESLGEQNLSITKMTVIQKWLVIQGNYTKLDQL